MVGAVPEDRSGPKVPVDTSIMDTRTDRGMVASGLVVAVAVVVLVAAVGFVLLTKRGGEEASVAASAVLDAATESDDRRAQSTLRNAMAASLTAFADLDTYDGVTPQMLGSIEPSLSFTGGPSTGSTVVSVATTSETQGLAVLSASGTCWWLASRPVTSGLAYGSGTACTGADALAGATATSW
jgi:hypothetical protein